WDFGNFTIPYTDEWYFLFINLDSDEQRTDINLFIHPPDYIEILVPDSYDSLTTGDSYEINYNCRNVDYINAYLYKDGVPISTLASNIAATGTVYWSIPDTLYSGDQYQIYIEDAYDGTVLDLGKFFTIDNPNEILYDEYLYYSFSVEGNDILNWGYTSLNPEIGARVYAMDEAEFDKLQNNDPYYKWILSETEISINSGNFSIPYNDTWYIVYINLDADAEPTILESNQWISVENFGGERLDYFSWSRSLFMGNLEDGDYLHWDYEGSNPLVGIRAYAMNDVEYANLVAGLPIDYHVLSDGTYCVNSGVWNVPSTDVWTIVFFNYDSDHQPTNFIHSITEPDEPDDDIYENNDEIYEATEILGGFSSHLVCLDADFYIVYLEAGESIELSINFAHSDGNLDLKFYDFSFNELASSTSLTDNEYIEYQVTNSDQYYILVDCIEPNLHYEMTLDIIPENTDPADDDSPDDDSSDDGFDLGGIPGYPFGSIFMVCAVSVVVVLRRKRKKT
ncbi:MAG: Loki-CTERM sorting domain-containing protein, partial [Promethearchaeota archaeon]